MNKFFPHVCYYVCQNRQCLSETWEWVIVVQLLSVQFFSHIMARTCYLSMIWWWCSLFNRITHRIGSYSARSLKRQPVGRHEATLKRHDSIPNSLSSFSLIKCKSKYIQILVCCLTCLGLEPTIYCTVGKHADMF